MHEIGDLTSRAGAITQELRRFSRRADRHIGNVSVQAVLAGIQLLLGDRLRSTNTRLSVDPIDTYVLGEQGRLEQVFVNLIQNAMDAMGDGGRIDIIVTRAEPWVSIAVRDTGPGISPELRGSLFEPFTSSKPDGVGLGLVICRDIVTQFGGELSLSEVSTGTEFRIMLKSAA